MKVWILNIDGGGPDKFHEFVFLSKEKAFDVADDLTGEWINYKPEIVEAEDISNSSTDRVIINNTVFKLNTDDNVEYLRKRALSKLSPEEQKSLGLTD